MSYIWMASEAQSLNRMFYFCYIVNCLPTLETGNVGSQTQEGVSICPYGHMPPVCFDAHTSWDDQTYQGWPNIQNTPKHMGVPRHTGGDQTYWGTIHKMRHQNIWGTLTCRGQPNILGTPKHKQMPKHTGVTKHMGVPQTYQGIQAYAPYSNTPPYICNVPIGSESFNRYLFCYIIKCFHTLGVGMGVGRCRRGVHMPLM